MSVISETYIETYKKLLQSFGTSSKEVKSCEPIVVEVSHLFHHDIGTDSIKYWGSCFITKCDINLLQNASGFSFSNRDCFVAKYDSYYKMWRLYYKMWHLLQKAWIQAQNREKCGDYRETLSQTVKPCDTWWNHEICEVWNQLVNSKHKEAYFL